MAQEQIPASEVEVDDVVHYVSQGEPKRFKVLGVRPSGNGLNLIGADIEYRVSRDKLLTVTRKQKQDG